ncbi:hypothetical protein LOZ12_003690 [Ophidiomyces ophidiicola]|uniref:Uncharacterized protein n=1 Tax=Ophidiomyces ophidiicola TaxID=1387563 RepID=A0ACB8UWI3_9EURO|nr:hypothetical protein LOZ62_001706 [Ophidiomyces ophidiicola]KAI1956613.1 hypothetical protein LOZ59_004215 [Ophidiomyces ophidiicola]KAI1972414.1 hypothetical protein LOZ56_002459 [Ophidiomyces ophidiicola]KAI2024130.1 hypothetical protein LOZ45_003722 [Ophidiomyces ophidiicola]KAI2039455.1 hypothetical protein LOZ47_002240 [Ophidiomyces ophidiicola]
MSTPPYLTPPQTRAHVSQMGGLDLLHCQSDQKVHAFTPSQGLLSTAVSWPSNTNSTQSYSNPVAKLGEYLHLGIYEGVDALPSHTSPFLSPHTTSTPSTMASLSSPMIQEESAGLMRGLQRNTDLPLAASSEKTIKTMPHSKNISRTFPRTNSSYEMLRFAPIETDPTPSNTLLELDNIIKREWCDGGVATQPVPDITSNPSNVTAMRISEVPKRFHKSITAISSKYGCPQCGMQFTRRSNCKSHIKIHDPNRKYSHQCTVTYCLKQFSRKTDLTRHIDSVRPQHLLLY